MPLLSSHRTRETQSYLVASPLFPSWNGPPERKASLDTWEEPVDLESRDFKLTPVVEFGCDVFGNKNNLPGLPYEFVFFRVGLGSDQRKDRGAVRRRNRQPPACVFKALSMTRLNPS
jgi:hypothetical protein